MEDEKYNEGDWLPKRVPISRPCYIAEQVFTAKDVEELRKRLGFADG